MKLLLMTDLHEREEERRWFYSLCEGEKPDGIICLGDLVSFRGMMPMPRRQHAYLKEVLRDLTTLAERVFFVPGNNDMRESLIYAEEIGVVCLHHTRVDLMGPVGLVGKGGSGPIPGAVTFPFEHTDQGKQAELLLSLAQPDDIWVLHEPVRGHRDLSLKGAHLGNPEYLAAWRELRPPLVLSGHVHEATGIERVGDRYFMNPGPLMAGVAGRLTVELGEGESIHLEMALIAR